MRVTAVYIWVAFNRFLQLKTASSSSWGGSPTSFLTRNTCCNWSDARVELHAYFNSRVNISRTAVELQSTPFENGSNNNLIYVHVFHCTPLLYIISSSIQYSGECDSYIYNDIVSFHCLGVCIHILIIYSESSCDRGIMQFIRLSILTSFSLSSTAGWNHSACECLPLSERRPLLYQDHGNGHWGAWIWQDVWPQQRQQ